MKFRLFALTLVLINCACNDSTNSQQATPSTPSLRQLAPSQPEDPFVILTPKGKGPNPRVFIEASGFPLNNITRQAGFSTLQEADKKYREYVARNPNHIYLDAFRQVAGSHIIRRFDLLNSDTKEKNELLGFYCTELTQEKTCFNPKLCYECLNKLSTSWPHEKINEMKQRVIPFFDKYQKAMAYRNKEIIEKARHLKDSDSTTFIRLEEVRKQSDQEKNDYIDKIKQF